MTELTLKHPPDVTTPEILQLSFDDAHELFEQASMMAGLTSQRPDVLYLKRDALTWVVVGRGWYKLAIGKYPVSCMGQLRDATNDGWNGQTVPDDYRSYELTDFATEQTVLVASHEVELPEEFDE